MTGKNLIKQAISLPLSLLGIYVAIATCTPASAVEETVTLNFPKAYSVGRIHKFDVSDDAMTGNSSFIGEARGTVKVPKSAQIYLIPDDGLVEHPERLDTIDPNSFYGFSAGAKGVIMPIEKILPHVAHLTGLKQLRLGSCDLKDDQLAVLTPLKKLELINLTMNEIDGSCLKYFTGMKNLYVVDLTFTPLKQAAFAELSKLPGLTHLKVGRCGVTDATMETLGKLKRLRVLYVAGSHISVRGLAHVNNLKELQVLNLRGCPLSVKDVLTLKLPNLSLLMLPSGNYRAEDMRAFNKAFPHCEFWNHLVKPDAETRTQFAPLH